jgi:IgGFc binding protein
VPPAIQGDTAVWTGQYGASGRGYAFHVQTDYPVTTYDILPYGGATSYLPGAELVMPTSAWGTNFVAVVPERGPLISWGPQFIQIVATQDGTNVTLLPTTDLPAGPNVAEAPPNQQTNVMLSAGEFIQWQDTHEASGTIVQSDKPVAVVGGNDYLCLPSATSPQGGGCDSAHQMIPSVNQLGSEYVIAPFLTRRKDLADESILYRIVGFVDGTTLTFDPPITSAPASLSRAQYADFQTTGAFRVVSQDAQHPFFIVQEMPGCPNPSRDGAQTLPNVCTPCLGDEDFVDVLPPAQFLQSYVFFTDPTYWTTNLALVRVKDSAGFHDVTVDCLGVVSGWKDVGGSGQYQVATAELVRGNVGIGTCTNGVHSATSAGRFGVTVWGEDCASSYGYPAGGNAAVLNQVVVPPTPK